MNKTEIRKQVSRKPFTVTQFSQAVGVTGPTARKRIAALVESGVLAEAGKTETGQRGRPAALYVVTPGRDRKAAS